jgi:hypothetical protein
MPKKEDLKAEIKKLRAENNVLHSAVREFAFWARRYCDNRSSYVASNYNSLVRILQAKYDVHFEVDPADGVIWARDGMGRAFDGLSEAEARGEDNGR